MTVTKKKTTKTTVKKYKAAGKVKPLSPQKAMIGNLERALAGAREDGDMWRAEVARLNGVVMTLTKSLEKETLMVEALTRTSRDDVKSRVLSLCEEKNKLDDQIIARGKGCGSTVFGGVYVIPSPAEKPKKRFWSWRKK